MKLLGIVKRVLDIEGRSVGRVRGIWGREVLVLPAHGPAGMCHRAVIRCTTREREKR